MEATHIYKDHILQYHRILFIKRKRSGFVLRTHVLDTDIAKIYHVAESSQKNSADIINAYICDIRSAYANFIFLQRHNKASFQGSASRKIYIIYMNLVFVKENDKTINIINVAIWNNE